MKIADGVHGRIQFAARNAALSVDHLARAFEIDAAIVESWLTGDVVPSEIELVEMVRLFDVSATWLLQGRPSNATQLELERLKRRADFKALPDTTRAGLVALMSTL